MPSKSAKQAAEHDPAFAKKMGIPQNVAREYVRADEGKFRASRSSVVDKRKKNNVNRFKPDMVAQDSKMGKY